MSIKIVKFKNGNYAVRKGNRFFGYRYLSRYSYYWFPYEYSSICQHSTLESAQADLENFLNPPPIDCGISVD